EWAAGGSDSTHMIDSIVGYHLNPWTRGIAKFNANLARYLMVPVVGILDIPQGAARHPLLSVKLSEFAPEHVELIDAWARERAGEYDLFLHAVSGAEIERRLIANAARVFCGNLELASLLRAARPDNVEVYCPGTIMA